MLSKSTIEKILDTAMINKCDFAEVYCDNNDQTTIQTAGDIIENGSRSRDFGVGIRVFSSLNNIYTYSNDLREENLLSLVKQASALLNSPNEKKAMPLSKIVSHKDSSIKILPSEINYGRKIDMLKHISDMGNSYDKRVKKITVTYFDGIQEVQIANTEGLYAEDTRVKTRVRIGAFADDGNQVSMGYIGPGAMAGFEFYENLDLKWYTEEACRMAIAMLPAEYAPAGTMSVIVDNGFGGLLFHEACGHSLEATAVSKGASEFCGKLNTAVASPLVTLIDDGSMPGKWGSLHIDDEGYKTQKNVLIDKGILKGYMTDRLNGKRMNMEQTGSARRQSYRFAPVSRMTNTYIASGESTREEIIANTEKGIFVKHINAGSVNPLSGEFNFSTLESYLIENGKITRPVKGATLIGTGREILQKVDMVGNNLKIGDGFCFADSGSLFICAGQPTVRVSSMTVGGTN